MRNIQMQNVYLFLILEKLFKGGKTKRVNMWSV